MGGINTNYANWIGIPVTKQCLNKMAGQFSSLMEMSSNSSPSGNNATNSYRKLTLYLNSQMRRKSSRHLISQMNTKIFIWNDLEQGIGKLCVLWSNPSTRANVDGTQGEWPIWMGFIREDLLKMDFTLFKAYEVIDWGWRQGLNSRWRDLLPSVAVSDHGDRSWSSSHLHLPVLPTSTACRLQEGRMYSRLFFSGAQLQVSWWTKPLRALFSIQFPKGLYLMSSINISMPPRCIHFH